MTAIMKSLLPPKAPRWLHVKPCKRNTQQEWLYKSSWLLQWTVSRCGLLKLWETILQRSCIHPTTTPEDATFVCFHLCSPVSVSSTLLPLLQTSTTNAEFFSHKVPVITHEICVPSCSNKCGMVSWIKVVQSTTGGYLLLFFLQPSQQCDWAGGQSLWLLFVASFPVYELIFETSGMFFFFCFLFCFVLFFTATVFALQSTARWSCALLMCWSQTTAYCLQLFIWQVPVTVCMIPSSNIYDIQ